MDEIDQLGDFAGDDADGADGADGADDGRREGRRTVIALAAAAGLGTLAVVGTVWMISVAGASPGSGLAGDSVGGALSTEATAGAGAAADEAASTSSGVDGATPTTLTSTFVPPSPSYSPVHSPTVVLPPPEQPTYTTAPSPTSTSPRTPLAPPPSSPHSSPTSVPRPASAVVTDVVLSCRRAGGQTRASITFRTTAPVAVWLTAGGGKIASGVKGPGQVTLQVSGGRAAYCLATVGQNSYGPIPAS